MRSKFVNACLCTAMLAASSLSIVATLPAQAQAQAATTSFTTAGCDTWVVPAGVSEVGITAIGAAGTSGDGGGAGFGAWGDGVSALLTGLSPGQILSVCVDVGGGPGSSGYAFTTHGGDGGGASGVALGSDFSSPVVVAGGGGGGGGRGAGLGGGNGGSPGDPATSGDNGADYGSGGGSGGGGATDTAAGTGGSGTASGTDGGAFGPAGPGAGGTGGIGLGGGGGGGGGGYFGGGGGGGGGPECGGCGAGGGGGGSDFCSDAVSVSGCSVMSGAGTQPVAGSAPGEAKVVINPGAPTTTGVSISPSSPVFGQTVTATATINPIPDGGTVQFALDGADVGAPVVVSTVTGTASTNLTGLPAGPHTVTATYSGTSLFQSGSSQTTFPVGLATTTTSVSTSPSDPVFGQTITATATVNPIPEGGAVQFALDGNNVGDAVPVDTNTGTASASLSVSGGTHTVAATYSGTANFAGSFGEAFLRIASAATKMTAIPALVQVSPLELELFKLSATLTRESDGSPLWGSPVVFSAGSTVLCSTFTDESGVARCSVAFASAEELALVLALGYTASFAGDDNFSPSSASAGLLS
jgi:hypothetical protein